MHRHDLLVDGPIIAIGAVFFVLRLRGQRRTALPFGIIALLLLLASMFLPK